ncbi:PQQ-binding-like beta-propeller repeat protein [bacterium]|nr:PQQ-binding-like beta-propeller repeat protein [bacterium]
MDYRIRWQQQRRQRRRKRLLIIPAALALAAVLYLLLRNVGGGGATYWVHEEPFHLTPHFAVSPSLVYAVWSDGHIEALRANTGAPTDATPFFSTPEGFNATPTVAQHILYVGSDAGVVRALDGRTGQKLWDHDTGAPVRCQPLLAGGRVYVGNEDGVVYCFMPGGTKVWTQRLTDGLAGQPALVEKLLIAATARGGVYGLDAGTGRVAWRVDLQTRDVPTPVFSPVTAAPPLALVGSDSGLLYVLDAATGKQVREPYYTGGLVRQAAAVSDQVIAFGSTDGWLRVVSRDAQEPLWAYQLPGPVEVGPVIAGNVIYVASATRLLALDAASGRLLRTWKGEQFAGDLAVTADTIYIGTNRGQLMALAAL